jgi:type IV secretory pathway component VirB8
VDLFQKGSQWDANRVADVLASRRRAYIVAGTAGALVVALAIAIIAMLPLRRTVPYLVKVDAGGNVEVLQTFDNRQIGKHELTDQYWARTYVKAREQYNWWMVGTDYETVSRLTEPTIFTEYGNQFTGEKGMDKVFGAATDRTIKILSVTPSPTQVGNMVVRFERTTKTKGMVVEPPTVFVVQLVYRYHVKTVGAQADLQQNPLGYEVISYRRDAEVGVSATEAVAKDVVTTDAGKGANK